MERSINDLQVPMDCWQVAEYLFGKEAVDKNHLLAGEAAQQMKAAGWTFLEYDQGFGEEIWQPPRKDE